MFTNILDIWLVNKKFVGNILKKPELICLHTDKWFQVFLWDIKQFNIYRLFVQLKGYAYMICEWRVSW